MNWLTGSQAVKAAVFGAAIPEFKSQPVYQVWAYNTEDGYLHPHNC